jgi:aminoglycoside 6-adenylyltransferase
MRSESEVISQILEYAHSDNKVRVVLHNGSRVNPNVRKDRFCDYDIAFSVTDITYFVQNQEWIRNFGELIIMQYNTMHNNDEEWHFFLMLFTDGIRIDLSFNDVKTIANNLDDSLTKVLLDKDNILPQLVPPCDKSYFTRKPTREDYYKTMNNILWCSTNVAKGLWREELPYAKHMLDVVVRSGIVRMLEWYVGMNHDWKINTGAAGRWLNKYLPDEIWDCFEKIYVGSNYEENWDALMEAGKLTNRIGSALADRLSYEYPHEDAKKVMEYLMSVRLLPKDEK